jgi:serine kinase of HPr protein (carbohydrate metabolism regulator)
VNGRINVHATGLVLGRVGLMLRGPSGSGKSLLALALIEAWTARGKSARLVADDRIDLEVVKAGLVMHAPPAIAGLIELRGRGIVSRPHVARAALHLVVDFVPKFERMVEEEELVTEVIGVSLPRCPVPKAGLIELSHQLLLVAEAVGARRAARAAKRQKST